MLRPVKLMPEPAAQAASQSQSSSDESWEGTMQRIMALTADNPQAFGKQPFANRLDAILEAVVPSRRDPTHEKVLTVVNALVANGAIRADEAAAVFSALLTRVSRYNSLNVQSNLERMATDVREAVARKARLGDSNILGSMAALNAFMATLPATVPRGQDDYTNFSNALRLLVTEVPNTSVYQSGPEFFLQTSRNGSQTVNLTKAFENLQSLWGVKAPAAERVSVSSLLTPNTRLLLLLLAPFSDSVLISRGSYVGYLLTLYREALGNTQLDERTYQEVSAVSRAMGADDTENLQATLNFLLSNQHKTTPREYSLTADEERVLRFVQQAVSLRLMQDGMTPSGALDATAAQFEPTFYAGHRVFLNRLMDYFHRAAALAPDYFINSVLNPKWLPPEGFFTGNFEIPEADDGFQWDTVGESLTRDPWNHLKEMAKRNTDEDSVSAPRSLVASRRPSVSSLLGAVGGEPVSSMALGSDSDLSDFYRLLDERVPTKNLRRGRSLMNNDMQNLTDMMQGWRTYRDEHSDLVQQRPYTSLGARPKQSKFPTENGSDDRADDGGLGGSGNPFAHLRPRGRM